MWRCFYKKHILVIIFCLLDVKFAQLLLIVAKFQLIVARKKADFIVNYLGRKEVLYNL